MKSSVQVKMGENLIHVVAQVPMLYGEQTSCHPENITCRLSVFVCIPLVGNGFNRDIFIPTVFKEMDEGLSLFFSKRCMFWQVVQGKMFLKGCSASFRALIQF